MPNRRCATLHRLRRRAAPRSPELPAKQAVAIPAAGGRAPAFTATTDAGERLSLSSLHGRWVILFFYPKDDTSG